MEELCEISPQTTFPSACSQALTGPSLEKAPVVKIVAGDSLLLMTISGLPRLEGRHEYTAEEVAGAKFRFAIYSVE